LRKGRDGGGNGMSARVRACRRGTSTTCVVLALRLVTAAAYVLHPGRSPAARSWRSSAGWCRSGPPPRGEGGALRDAARPRASWRCCQGCRRGRGSRGKAAPAWATAGCGKRRGAPPGAHGVACHMHAASQCPACGRRVGAFSPSRQDSTSCFSPAHVKAIGCAARVPWTCIGDGLQRDTTLSLRRQGPQPLNIMSLARDVPSGRHAGFPGSCSRKAISAGCSARTWGTTAINGAPGARCTQACSFHDGRRGCWGLGPQGARHGRPAGLDPIPAPEAAGGPVQ
jgi:hypothetical protein